MFKNHPKGLFTLAIANMGERFGYYTMLAVFTLYLQAKFGFSQSSTSTIFGGFLALVYFLPLLGGFIADKFWGYGKTIILGIVVMFVGYVALSIPLKDDLGVFMMFVALVCIALGTGLFKGNLQVLVGNLYDEPKYSANRDVAFSIFYMCINIGAFFAPSAATAVSEYFLKKGGFTYVSEIPSMAHQLIDGTISTDALTKFQELAAQQGATGDLQAFAHTYIDALGTSYNYGFAVACFSLVISMLVFVLFRKTYAHANKNEKEKAKDIAEGKTVAAPIVELTAKQTKDRMVALGLVFAVVIFFWMAFHQNGLTMTFFARDYTASEITGLTRIGFSLLTLVPMIMAVYGLINLFQSKKSNGKMFALGALLIGSLLTYFGYASLDPTISIKPQIFQQFNPFFIIILTPIVIGIFSHLNQKGKEPLAPRKIGIGMVIAAIGFVVLAFASIGLPTPDAAKAAGGVAENMLVSPNWLISTYFVLTIAELFLSPMGISFVSRVAPPKYKGLAQGGWFAATAIGNYLVAIIGYLWGGIELWLLWTILIVLCLLSAMFLFSQMKKLEKTTREA